MEELFTKETLEMVFNLLESVSDGSVTVLVTYFLLPLFMLIVEAGVWLAGVVIITKYIKVCVEKYLSKELTKVFKVSMSKQVIHVEDEEKLKELLESFSSSSSYIHNQHILWFKQAIENQKKLEEENGGGCYSPYVYVPKKVLKEDV